MGGGGGGGGGGGAAGEDTVFSLSVIPSVHHSNLISAQYLESDGIRPNFAYAFMLTRSTLGLLRLNFLEGSIFFKQTFYYPRKVK